MCARGEKRQISRAGNLMTSCYQCPELKYALNIPSWSGRNNYGTAFDESIVADRQNDKKNAPQKNPENKRWSLNVCSSYSCREQTPCHNGKMPAVAFIQKNASMHVHYSARQLWQWQRKIMSMNITKRWSPNVDWFMEHTLRVHLTNEVFEIFSVWHEFQTIFTCSFINNCIYHIHDLRNFMEKHNQCVI